MGVVELAPTKLLQDGLRAHLARRIASAAAASLSFSQHAPPLALPQPPPGSARPGLAGLFGAGAALSDNVPGRRERLWACMDAR